MAIDFVLCKVWSWRCKETKKTAMYVHSRVYVDTHNFRDFTLTLICSCALRYRPGSEM